MVEGFSGIDAILAAGNVLDGHRTRKKAQSFVPELKKKLSLSAGNTTFDESLGEFAMDVILGAAWYTRKLKSARNKARLYILANAMLVVAIPGAAWGMTKFSGPCSVPASVSQLSSLFTGIFALQKTVSSWFSQQQQYATWYQSASDLKQIYYELLRQHGSKGAGATLAADLDSGADKARKIMDAERLGFYQRLALPSMDVLDMLTGSGATVTKLVSGLMPVAGDRATQAVAMGTKTVAGVSTPP